MKKTERIKLENQWLVDRLEKLLAENERLREALAWLHAEPVIAEGLCSDADNAAEYEEWMQEMPPHYTATLDAALATEE